MFRDLSRWILKRRLGIRYSNSMAGNCLLYYITNRSDLAQDEPQRRRRLLDKIAEAVRAGVDYIQLREKDLTTRELECLAADAMGVLHEARANQQTHTKLLINSRTDVALAVGADGVHLRSDDISPLEVRAAWEGSHGGNAGRRSAQGVPAMSRERPLIGVSCHSVEEVRCAAAQETTFAVFAPIFEKKDAPTSRPAGLAQLREACTVRLPVLALGGITLKNARQCLDAGATGIAGIRLFQENPISDIVAELRSTTRSA